jgi:hypothetical protein
MKKSWQELIHEGARTVPSDPREAFIAELAKAHSEVEQLFKDEGRSIQFEKGKKLGEGTIIVQQKLRKELVLGVNASEKAVAFRIFNIGMESVDCHAGSPDDYTASTLRNIIAYFYNLSVKREKIPRNLNASDFAE